MEKRDYTPGAQLQVRQMLAGQLTDMLEVHYQGPAGITGWVRVPVATASAEQVDALIRAQLAEQLKIHALGVSQQG